LKRIFFLLERNEVTIKRLILALLTVLAIARVLFSLSESLTQPQVQNRLELYQTNLVLHVAEFQPDRLDTSADQNADLTAAIESFIGEDPYSNAEKQYQKILKEAQISRSNFQNQLKQKTAIRDPALRVLPHRDGKERTSRSDFKIIPDARAKDTNTDATPVRQQQLQQEIQAIDDFINEIDLKLGILIASQGKTEQALSIWNQLINRLDDPENKYTKTATILSNLWKKSPQILPNAESILKNNLNSWFSYRALQRLYRIQADRVALSSLETQQQERAIQALFKLALIGGIPILGGMFGVIILIFLIVQLLLKKETSILATNRNITWETPWNWEIVWQVLIVGFFFISQFVVPIILGLSGLSLADSSVRFKAVYVLVTYVLMALGGILVLYFSLKAFFPLPSGWFKFKLISNWFVWGFGGYLIAIPLVLLVSLINQQIWHGQGGSNPILFLALQAQDRVALAIFFITASIAAPIFEEIMFRGFLLPSLTRYMSVSTAIILSAFIFAIAHLSLSEVLPLATLGIILGIIYTRSRNLLAPMLLHSLWNSGTLLSLFVLGSGVN
jgi:membrane protease YdiL (CAAX protease family)